MAMTESTQWIGFSGGLDSSVLLHQLVERRRKNFFILRAVHIHHGLHAHADQWQQHCENICQKWQVDCIVHKLNLVPGSANLEAQAREKRYHFFASLLQEGDVFYTAHHQDDQAETLLLQLIRGSGPQGLSGMAYESSLGLGQLRRPLLDFSRESLLAYAKQHQLTWVEDESNQHTHFLRNFIRHDILPLFKKRLPSVARTLARSAKHCAETQQLLHEYASLLMSNANRLKVSSLKKLTFAQQKLVFRHCLSQKHLLLPNEARLENLLQTFLFAAEDKNPMMSWGDVEIRRYRDEIHMMKKLQAHDPTQCIAWLDLRQALVIESLSMVLRAEKCQGEGLRIALGDSVELRFRVKDAGFKKRFQAFAVPPWQRDRIPLLYVNGKLAAFIGYEVCQDFRVDANEVGYKISMEVVE